MSLFAIVCLVIIVIVLIGFLIYKNQKDEQSFEKQINNDYPQKEDPDGDIEIEEKPH